MCTSYGPTAARTSVRITGLHALRRSRSDQPPCKDSAGGVRPALPGMDVTLWWVCSTMRKDFATLGYKAESNGVPPREGFLHRALQRGCVASMLVGVEQYGL